MTRSQEIGKRDPESTPLRSRQSLRLTDPDYDRHVLAFLKSKIAIDANGCWLWQGFIHPDTVLTKGKKVGQTIKGGYGKTSYRRRCMPVHRVMWIILNGAPPPKMDVCHSCDVRACCNPDHLWLGTRKQNLLDMVAKKRGNKASKTVCKYGHPLSGDNVYIHQRRRKCKACEAIRNKTLPYILAARERQRRNRAAKRAQREQRA